MPRASRNTASTPDVHLVAETDDFARLFARSSDVDAKLRTGLRRNIRNAAKAAAADSKAEVLKPPLRQGQNPKHTGLRERIAAGIGVSILTGNSRVGVQISSRGFLARGYDKETGWRHPVFGNREVWRPTYGRPYFRSRIGAHQAAVTRVVVAAMTEAAASLEGKT